MIERQGNACASRVRFLSLSSCVSPSTLSPPVTASVVSRGRSESPSCLSVSLSRPTVTAAEIIDRQEATSRRRETRKKLQEERGGERRGETSEGSEKEEREDKCSRVLRGKRAQLRESETERERERERSADSSFQNSEAKSEGKTVEKEEEGWQRSEGTR